MSEAPQKKGTSWSIGIGLGIVALLIGTAIVTEPSVSFSSSGNRGCAPAGTETPLRLQTNTLSISAPGIVKASYLTMLSPSVSGKVDKVHPLFNVGEIVLKGTPLMELVKFEYRARLANAQAELEQAERELSQKREEAKSRKKLSGIAPQKGNISELQAQMNLIRQKTAAAKEIMKAVDAALETLEEKSGKQERLMQKAEEKLTEQKNKVLADDDRDESAVPEPGDEDLLASAEYRELSGDVRKTLEQARKKEEQASRAYDEARAAMRKASREEVKKLAKKEKDHASFQKLFTGAASVAGFILLLFTGAAFRSSNS